MAWIPTFVSKLCMLMVLHKTRGIDFFRIMVYLYLPFCSLVILSRCMNIWHIIFKSHRCHFLKIRCHVKVLWHKISFHLSEVSHNCARVISVYWDELAKKALEIHAYLWRIDSSALFREREILWFWKGLSSHTALPLTFAKTSRGFNIH